MAGGPCGRAEAWRSSRRTLTDGWRQRARFVYWQEREGCKVTVKRKGSARQLALRGW
jgi:hypothetical protein